MAGLTGDMMDYNNVPATVSPLPSLTMLYMQLAHSVIPLKKKTLNEEHTAGGTADENFLAGSLTFMCAD